MHLSTRWRKALVAFIGVAVLFVIAMVLVGIFAPTPDEIATAAPAVSTITPTQLATATPIPTVPPTETCPSPEEQAYFDAVQRTMRSTFATLEIVGDDFTRAGQNPRLLNDAIWIMGIESNTYATRHNANTLRALVPPPAAVDIHATVTRMAEELLIATNLIDAWTVSFDADVLDNATEYMVLIGDDAGVIRASMNPLNFCN